MQDPWLRVCQLKYGRSKEVVELTVRSVCESRLLQRCQRLERRWSSRKTGDSG